MNIFKSYKVLTFIKLKITAILLILLSTIFIGYRYLNSTEIERNSLISNISKNENDISKNSLLTNKIYVIDDVLLSGSLNKKINIDSIGDRIVDITKYSSEITGGNSIELDSIIIKKSSIYKEILFFEYKKVDLDKVKSIKKINTVSTTIKKGLFKKKVQHDTISTTYDEVNKVKYNSEYNSVTKSNSDRLNLLIKENNRLSIEMKVIIDKISGQCIIKNLKENELIFDKLKENIKYYTRMIIILLLMVMLLIYLLLLDIRKIKKENSRRNETISFLIDLKEKKE